MTIGSLLRLRGVLAGPALDRAQRLQAESGERIDRIAAKLGMVSDADLAACYAELLGSGILCAANFPAEPVASDRLQGVFLKHARVIPLAESDSDLTVAMADPLDDTAVAALAFALEKPVLRRVALPTDIEAAWEWLYGESGGAALAADAIEERVDEDRDADDLPLRFRTTANMRDWLPDGGSDAEAEVHGRADGGDHPGVGS